MIQLRTYQDHAVERLEEAFDYLLQSSENEICVLDSPTGSGKTIMVAEFLRRFVKKNQKNKNFSFVWISVRRLHEQSKEKLEKYYEGDHTLECSYFDDLLENKIEENEILFLNWESIKSQDRNIIVKEDKETEHHLQAVLNNTQEEDRELILIIDESHYAASTKKAKDLIDMINPKITLEVSATPQLKAHTKQIVPVLLSEVKEDEMIKTEIIVNPEFLKLKLDPKSTTQIVIEHALKKRQEMKTMFMKEKSDVNPLILVQLPDKKEGEEKKRDEVEKILEKLGIKIDNGKLAIWLSEEKSENLANIEIDNNEVEALIFKQAIGLGWDCPRASILVIFRESKSVVFTKQVIGRIMRMPEHKHYPKHPELNNGFIFTNLEEVEAKIQDEFVKDYVSVFEAKRNDKVYQKISLPSVFLKTRKTRPRISREFLDIFTKVAKDEKLKSNITYPPSEVIKPVISDGIIPNIDKIGDIAAGGNVELKLGDLEIAKIFDAFISSMASPYAPRESSHWLKVALYGFLEYNFKIENLSTEAQKTVLDKKNVVSILHTIRKAKEKFKEKISQKLIEKREQIDIEEWEVPSSISYTTTHNVKKAPKSIMQPLYVKKLWVPEENFIKTLENSDKVKWWYNNGEKDIKYFAVIYQDEYGEELPFYVDFIVAFTDGRIGLFDTKSGFTAEKAGPKSDGLQKYLQKHKKTRKELFGGITTETDGGGWLYYDKPKYHYDKKDQSDWEDLNI